MDSIPYSRHEVTQADIDAVSEILRSDFLTQGSTVSSFESRFKERIGVDYAVAVSNGTAALHLACLALGVDPDTVVYTTPITFVASANCARYCGGRVQFVDIDPDNYCLDLNKLQDQLAKDTTTTKKTIIPVDFAGYPIVMSDLYSIAEKFNCSVIEDACHAPGGSYLDGSGVRQACGNCSNADMATFSFHPVKHIACGEGGMITTNDPALYEKLILLRTHGITRFFDRPEDPWYYEMQELGYNYRLTDIQAALGSSQLERLDDGNQKRHQIAARYNQGLEDLPIKLPKIASDLFHAYHLYVIQTEQRDELYRYLREESILCQVHYIPVNAMPYYKALGYCDSDTPVAQRYYQRCLSLPMYPSLTEDSQSYVIDKIQLFFSKFTS